MSEVAERRTMIPEDYLVPYFASNLIAVVLLVTAVKWLRSARFLFAPIVILASIVNANTANSDPEDPENALRNTRLARC